MTIPYTKIDSSANKTDDLSPAIRAEASTASTTLYGSNGDDEIDYLLPTATPVDTNTSSTGKLKRGFVDNKITAATSSTITIPNGNVDGEAVDNNNNNIPVAEVLSFEDRETRLVFIRKVYGILAGQMVLTFGVCAFMILHQPTQEYVLTHVWPMQLMIPLSIVVVIALMCFKDVQPHNMVLLIIFTVIESFLVGVVTTMYCASGYEGVVLEAVFLTGAVFIGLTIFTFQSRIDFSFLGAGLSMCLWVLLLWGFMAIFFGFYDGYYYALFGCIVFCGYILFDTWLIMNKLRPHEYVLAAIMLYLDLINLFLYILRLLSSDRR